MATVVTKYTIVFSHYALVYNNKKKLFLENDRH